MIGKPSYIVSEYSYWNELSINPNAIPILEQNLDQINWENLSMNPYAIHILEKNLDKIDWTTLSTNPNAIPILERNIDKVRWFFLSLNPNAIHLLAPLDHKIMKDNMKVFNQELTEYVMNPVRLLGLCKQYDISFEELVEYY